MVGGGGRVRSVGRPVLWAERGIIRVCVWAAFVWVWAPGVQGFIYISV